VVGEQAMIKKIVIAMSLRNTGSEPLELAAGIVSAAETELIVVSIIDKKDVERVSTIAAFGYHVCSHDYVRKVITQRMGNLKQIVGGLAYPESKFRTIIRIGDPASEIVKIIINEMPDMVIVKEGHRLTPEGLFRSSITKAVIKKSPVSVTVAK
jgi:nucleotide-binding universal stress UspA family protein